jgi:predicted phosphodiesterase
VAGADLVLHAGDFVSLQFHEELAKLGPPLEGVAGNMDEPALKQALPKQRVVEVAGLRIGMLHDPGPRLRRERASRPGSRTALPSSTATPMSRRSSASSTCGS